LPPDFVPILSTFQFLLNFHIFSWNNFYDDELRNFKDFGDEGMVWFGKVAENRMLKFMNGDVNKAACIIDLGCGNGSLLRKLVRIFWLRRVYIFFFSTRADLLICAASTTPKRPLILQNRVHQVKKRLISR
jgi:hypothetical protein